MDAPTADPLPPRGVPGFATTRWSLIRRAGEGADRDALEELCRLYWYPLYAFARRSGRHPADAEDAVQGFFSSFLESGHVAGAQPERGRFRSWILGAFRHDLSHAREKERAARRGGRIHVLALDARDGERRWNIEPSDKRTPEDLFDRAWALAVLDHAKSRLAHRYAEEGLGDLWDRLATFLSTPRVPGEYREAGRALGMTEGAVRVAVHRMRTRFATAVRDEILTTVAEDGVDDELTALIAALSE